MSLNITFDGYVSLDDGTLSNSNVQYQAYFYKIGAGSSPSTWNDVRTVESTGYYNCNLGDGTWLSQTGNVAPGDKVIIVFWRGGNRMGTDCSVLDEWGATEHVLTSADVYTAPTQVKKNILPTLDWSFPTNGVAGTPYTSTNDSDDEHTWIWSGTTMAHWYIRYTEPIYFINYVRLTHYDWDDGTFSNNLPLASTGSHSWTLAGDYTVQIVIEDHCGGTVTGTENIRIKYPPPVPNIDCNEDNGSNHVITPDTVVTFDYNGTNPYNTISTIDWTIGDDTNTVSNGHGVPDVVPHTNGEGTSWYGHTASPGAFTDPGSHNVAIVVHWNDGFDDKVINYNENFYQDLFTGPTVDFNQVPNPVAVTSGVVFNNLTTNYDRVGTAGAGEEYDWEWNDEGNLDNVNDAPYSYIYSNIPGSDDVTVELCAHWNDGWNDYVECELKKLAIKTTVAVVQNDCYYELTIFGTSLDGSVTGYHWEISRSTTSGIAGPYELIWESPTGMDQKEKTVAFTEQNYFEVKGFVHGNGDTDDYEVIYVDTVCPGEECALVIWNGTGEHDSGGDWDHTGHGTEEAYAKYEGTNGLDATGFTNNKKIYFQNTLEVNVDEYDLLSMYINLKEWPSGANATLIFEDGHSVLLSNYLETLNLNTWQRVLIPLEDFGLIAPINLKKLTITSSASIGFYLDNVEFVVGTTLRTVIDVGRPDMDADLINKPSMKATRTDYRPQMSAYPPPLNL
jgi:hypothetical protein